MHVNTFLHQYNNQNIVTFVLVSLVSQFHFFVEFKTVFIIYYIRILPRQVNCIVTDKILIIWNIIEFLLFP